MPTTHRKSRVPISEASPISWGSVQWLLESEHDKHAPFHRCNKLTMLYCGEEGFRSILDDIKQARASVEIICWGFDPAMELERERGQWPRGESWGGLLRNVAAGRYNGGKPVQVRLLSWYGFIGSSLAKNMPGFRQPGPYEPNVSNLYRMGRQEKLPPSADDPQGMREAFNAQWYHEAEQGLIENLSLRIRDGDVSAVLGSLSEEPGKRGLLETVGMAVVATDHQKTILIDYEHEGGVHAVGYVMGLNSVTDYWDTEEHLFYDPRRGESWEGGTKDGRPGLKPYQDYACRIQGEALVGISKNFTDAWNRAKGRGTPLKREHDVHRPPPGLWEPLRGQATVNAQIVRTQPEEGDKTIKRLYRQASSFARSYLYVENQYFQYTEWAQELKENRNNFVQGCQRAGLSLDDVPVLHVMAVIPAPELAQMVPRTYDTVRALGHGESMPNQDKLIEDELQKQREWERYASDKRAKGEVPNPMLKPPEPSALAQSAASTGTSKENVSEQLKTLGMRTLIGTLWTYDHAWRSRTPLKDGESARLGDRYREIYIHSKLMVIDDSMFTVGSANLNLRSMAVDAEINVACDDPAMSAQIRKHVWGRHTGDTEKCNPVTIDRISADEAFNAWKQLMDENEEARVIGSAPSGFLFPFKDSRTSRFRLA